MGKRNRYRDHMDPEHQRWGRTYPAFPGVAECVRLIVDGKASATWADLVVHELAANAGEHLEELKSTFHKHLSNQDGVALFLMMAIELAALPSSVDFLSWVLEKGDPRFVPYAKRALAAIDTRESRSVLFRLAPEEGN